MKTSKLFNLIIAILSVSSFGSCASKKQVNDNFYADYSTKLGVQLKGNENRQLIRSMYAWKGTPYKYGAATKKGTDCSGFVSQLYKEVYNKKLHRTSRDMVKDVKFISKGKLQAGDLLFFKINKRRISHVGVYIGNDKFIHATTKRGVKVDDLNFAYYKKHYYKSGRVKI